MANVVGGITSCRINGTLVDVKQELKFNAITLNNEYQPNWSNQYLYSQTPKPGMLTVTVFGGAALQQLFQGLANSIIVIGLATGEYVTFGDATFKEAGEVDAKEGTFDVTFEGFLVISSGA